MDRPIRIMFAINTLERGGSERQLVELATGLDRARFAPSVVCVVSGGPLADELATADIPVAVFRARTVSGLVALVAHTRRLAPDIVHAFLFGSNVIGTFAATIARVPVVITSRRSLSFFKDGRPHYDLLQGIANRFTDVVVSNSEAVRMDTIRRERLDPAKIRVIPNGVNLERLGKDGDAAALRAELLREGSGPLVVVVANLIQYKGLDYFVDAWRDVLKRLPQARAVVVGEGPERHSLESKAADISHGLRFIGSRNDVPAILTAADLLVQSSLEEGMPNAVLEAMAVGRAVVATAVGGTVEVVENERTGHLVPPKDSRALAESIVRVLQDSDLRQAYGSAGRRRIEGDFSLAAMVASYSSLYRSFAR
jgi:glycosyltransferase involved in cell wall biosynthesis